MQLPFRIFLGPRVADLGPGLRSSSCECYNTWKSCKHHEDSNNAADWKAATSPKGRKAHITEHNHHRVKSSLSRRQLRGEETGALGTAPHSCPNQAALTPHGGRAEGEYPEEQIRETSLRYCSRDSGLWEPLRASRISSLCPWAADGRMQVCAATLPRDLSSQGPR